MYIWPELVNYKKVTAVVKKVSSVCQSFNECGTTKWVCEELWSDYRINSFCLCKKIYNRIRLWILLAQNIFLKLFEVCLFCFANGYVWLDWVGQSKYCLWLGSRPVTATMKPFPSQLQQIPRIWKLLLCCSHVVAAFILHTIMFDWCYYTDLSFALIFPGLVLQSYVIPYFACRY